MFPSALLSIPQLAAPAAAAPPSDSTPRVRAGTAVVFVIAYSIAGLGLYWDIVWHTYLGRDRFLTPPHALLYAGIAVAGLAALGSILYESFARRDDERPSFLGLRGARGMFVAGFGVLATVVAAPFDDWWHRVYGLDVTLWAPFHLMGLFGALISVVGLAYALANVANAVRGSARTWLGYNLYEWLLFYDLAATVALVSILIQPGLRIVPLIGVASFALMPAPLLAAGPLTILFVAAVTYAERPAGALAVVAIYIVRQSFFAITVPLLTAATVASYQIQYRVAGFEPHVTPGPEILLLALVPGALAVALPLRSGQRLDIAGALAGILFALGITWWVASAQNVVIPLPNVVAAPVALDRLLAALPLTLLASALFGAWGARIGRGFGLLLRAE